MLLTLLLLLAPLAVGRPLVIDDAAVLEAFTTAVGKFAESNDFPSAEALAASAAKAPERFDFSPGNGTRTRRSVESIFVLGGVYKCDDCEHWHASGIGAAWALSRDGPMVTNYHVFEAIGGEFGNSRSRAGADRLRRGHLAGIADRSAPARKSRTRHSVMDSK